MKKISLAVFVLATAGLVLLYFDGPTSHEYKSGYNADLSIIPNKDFSATYNAINSDWIKPEDTWYY